MIEMNIKKLRRQYPKGTVLVLDAMDDPQAPPVGTKGTVEFVDDAGMIHMHWETGSSLGLAPGEDSFHKMQVSTKF